MEIGLGILPVGCWGCNLLDIAERVLDSPLKQVRAAVRRVPNEEARVDNCPLTFPVLVEQ